MGRFIMTTHTTLSAARQTGRKDRPRVAGVFPRHAPTQTTAFLIANLELEFIASNRKTSPLKISNRKKIAGFACAKVYRDFAFTEVAQALLFTQRHEACALLLGSAFHHTEACRPRYRPASRILIETPRLKFPATTTKLSPLPISNRDKMGHFHRRRDSSRTSSQPALPPDG